MSAELLYRPPQRWQIWCAFACALALHLAAVAIAQNRGDETPEIGGEEPGVEIIAIDSSEPPVVEPVEPPPVEPPPVITENEDEDIFPEENATPAPVRPRNPQPAAPIARRAERDRAPASIGVAKVVALSMPRPDYPYEARRQRMTGSGMAILTVDFASGNVVDVRIARSTGSAILDNATTVGLRRWRFKPGTVSTVHVPITFTLSGPIY